jgi:3D (Asp-Asp-Asp) domain-containing protein/peptidoglycan/xylan/chitin deacetylase (PgdA/CDA1 family)
MTFLPSNIFVNKIQVSKILLLAIGTTMILIIPVHNTLAAITLGDQVQRTPIQSACRCVIFRMDDIQDFGFQAGQLAVMNMFLSKNLKLTTGIIMHDIGNDTKVMDKIKEGYQKGLFELALHGWKHVDYTKLSLADQTNSLIMANIKMYKIFGNTSDIFFPPYGPFNMDTIQAMHQLDLQIISSTLPDEYNFDHSFVTGGIARNDESNNTVYHMSAMTLFKSHPIENILADVVQLIQKYGYAGIILHPQDFLKMGADTNFTNIVEENEIRDLSRLIDYITSQNIPIKSFHEVLGQINQMYLNSGSLSRKHIGMSKQQICSTGWTATGYFTPYENDYNGSKITVKVDGISRTFFKSFLDDVNEESTGKSKEGDYIVTYNAGKTYNSIDKPLTSIGTVLRIGDIATDPSVIPSLTKNVMIPTLLPPWNSQIFTATDTGLIIKGKHIDVYTGEGKAAKDETIRITSSDNILCY